MLPLLYVSHSKAVDYRNELYAPLQASDLVDAWELFLPHSGGSVARNTREVVRGARAVLAEVSQPATGLGIELGWADAFGVPIVALHRHDARPSGSLAFVARLVLPYQRDRLVDTAREGLQRIGVCVEDTRERLHPGKRHRHRRRGGVSARPWRPWPW